MTSTSYDVDLTPFSAAILVLYSALREICIPVRLESFTVDVPLDVLATFCFSLLYLKIRCAFLILLCSWRQDGGFVVWMLLHVLPLAGGLAPFEFMRACSKVLLQLFLIELAQFL